MKSRGSADSPDPFLFFNQTQPIAAGSGESAAAKSRAQPKTSNAVGNAGRRLAGSGDIMTRKQGAGSARNLMPREKGIAMKKTVILFISALIWHWCAVPLGAQQRGRPQTLRVPSDRFPAALEVKQVIISQGGRGIAGSFSDLTVEDTTVTDMLWHGVSIVRAKGKVMFAESAVELCLGIGCYINDTEAGPGEISLLNDVFGLNSGGGILISGNAKSVLVTKCFLSNNRDAGIRLKNVGLAALCHNLVNFTQPRLLDGKFGDGIVAECSENVIICQ